MTGFNHPIFQTNIDEILDKLRQAYARRDPLEVAYFGAEAQAFAMMAVQRELYVAVEELKGLRADIARARKASASSPPVEF